jgi:hypothetical protein
MISLISSFEEDSPDSPHGLLFVAVGSLKPGPGIAAPGASVESAIDGCSGLVINAGLEDAVASKSMFLALASDLKLVLEVSDGLTLP